MLTWEKVLTDLVPFHMLILYAFIDPLGVVIGVWMGNDDNTLMRNVTGGSLPARLFRDIAVEIAPK